MHDRREIRRHHKIHVRLATTDVLIKEKAEQKQHQNYKIGVRATAAAAVNESINIRTIRATSA